jgi:hypothetical protein
MKKQLLISSLLAAALAAAGCATASPQAEARLTMTGKLVLKGSMPKVRVVLIRSETEQWELQNVPVETAEELQNQRVNVEGFVTREVRSGMFLPSMSVNKIAPAKE